MMIRKRLLIKYLSLQILLWSVADLFLSLIIRLTLLTSQTMVHTSLLLMLLMALGVGMLQGLVFGITDQLLDTRYFKKMALGKILLIKVGIYFFTTLLIIVTTRQIIQHDLVNLQPNARQISWTDLFHLMLLYNMIIAPLITFINQVNRHVLGSLLFGKYRIPRDEYRIFLFMDLTGSTSIAESLGHIRYSEFIRDCFMDINMLVPKYDAQIYQYAGDEVILSWKLSDRSQVISCVEFFMDSREEMSRKSSYYQNRYGICPDFKAGAHLGNVTAVEIGDIKRDIAYHGDVLNTASRLQHLCNQYGHKLLVSEEVICQLPAQKYAPEPVGNILLKGKYEQVKVYGL